MTGTSLELRLVGALVEAVQDQAMGWETNINHRQDRADAKAAETARQNLLKYIARLKRKANHVRA